MVELHGWIKLRETYKAVDEDNDDEIIKNIQEEIDKIEYPKLQIRAINGEFFIDFSLYTNHLSGDVKDLIAFFETVGKIAEGSYGLLYLHNDEDEENYNNFIVHRLARGKVEIYRDKLLSPIIPTIEDAWI